MHNRASKEGEGVRGWSRNSLFSEIKKIAKGKLFGGKKMFLVGPEIYTEVPVLALFIIPRTLNIPKSGS